MFYEIPKNLAAELVNLESHVKPFHMGELDAASFKARRLPFGCYDQRRDGNYMVRIRVTGEISARYTCPRSISPPGRSSRSTISKTWFRRCATFLPSAAPRAAAATPWATS